MDVVDQLKRDGINKGLCRLWQLKLVQGINVEELANLYVKGIDFCISEDYPTLDFLRNNFKGKCERFGIYIDEDIIGVKNQANVVLNGACKAAFEYDDYSVSNIYARHDAVVAVNASDNAFVIIDAFDNAHLYVAVSGNDARVIVNLYGDAIVESLTEGVIVKRKNKKTY